MGEKLPTISARELIRALSKIGIVPVSQRGSHIKLQGEHNGVIRYTTIPVHGNEDLPKGILHAVMGDLGLTREEFLALLGKK